MTCVPPVRPPRPQQVRQDVSHELMHELRLAGEYGEAGRKIILDDATVDTGWSARLTISRPSSSAADGCCVRHDSGNTSPPGTDSGGASLFQRNWTGATHNRAQRITIVRFAGVICTTQAVETAIIREPAIEGEGGKTAAFTLPFCSSVPNKRRASYLLPLDVLLLC